MYFWTKGERKNNRSLFPPKSIYHWTKWLEGGIDIAAQPRQAKRRNGYLLGLKKR